MTESTSITATNNNNRSTIRAFIEQTINDHQVVVFSKTYCPYCGSTKQLLGTSTVFDKAGIKIVEIDMMGYQGQQIQRELLVMTGQRTVPSVWVNGKHIGGNDETQRTFRGVSSRISDDRRRRRDGVVAVGVPPGTN